MYEPDHKPDHILMSNVYFFIFFTKNNLCDFLVALMDK